MRSFLKFSFFMLLFTMAFFIPSLAQDSTAVVTADPVTDLFSWLVGFVPTNWQVTILVVVTGLFLLEQVLAANESVKANSTFQLVAGWIATLYKVIKGVKK